jgi:hypothetical protein
MIELALVAAACVGMGKIADAEGRSSLMWGILTLGLCLAASVVIPLPLLRILIAGVAAFIIMMVAKAFDRR